DPDMDEQSRALIASMLAEEQLYLGQGTVALPGSSSSAPNEVVTDANGKRKRPPTATRKRTKNEQVRSHNLKWTKEEDAALREGIVFHGYGAWKQIAAQMRTRTALQIKNHVRHLTVYGGVHFEGADESQQTLAKSISPQIAATTATAVAEPSDDQNVEEEDIDISGDDEEAMIPAVQPLTLEPLSDTAETDESADEVGEEAVVSPPAAADIPATSRDIERMEVDELIALENESSVKQDSDEDYAKSSLQQTADGDVYGEQSVDRHESGKEDQPGLAKAECQKSPVSASEIVQAIDSVLNPADPTLPDSAANNAIDRDIVSRHEVTALPEWFLSTLALSQGKKPHPRTLHKTPERYMKIRNYILNAWDKRKPKYLTKTSVRPGLKGEGDVNAIGRIHDYLEQVGAINVGCPEKGGRKNYGMNSAKKGKDEALDDFTEQEAGSVWNFIDEGQRRKRRVRNAQGEWVDEDGNGAAASDLSKEELEIAREEARLFALNSKYFADEELEKFDKRLLKRRQRQQTTNKFENGPVSDVLGEYDPFRLIPNRAYSDSTHIPPFTVTVESNALITMDFHSHLAQTEIIGLLGGTYDALTSTLSIRDVFPCQSMSTGVQCEMDPDSEVQARDAFAQKELDVVGWYHSHPTFEPIPSIRDIENQTNYQTLFQRHDTGVEPFIGAIVSPYDPAYAAARKSKIGWVHISQEWNSGHEYRLPYACVVSVVPSERLGAELFAGLVGLVGEYRGYEHRMDLSKPFASRHDPSYTRLDKLINSIESHAQVVGTADETQAFVTRLREMVVKGFGMGG
ncbi:SWIRM domain-containing protein, partial [Fimicolochytrium jonesii]|uniref:SWIRM domain-containing protein n=1 Tax=Fimicolochytrium jonesii TaxID=1396493 RepID=UPI0022FDD2CE